MTVQTIQDRYQGYPGWRCATLGFVVEPRWGIFRFVKTNPKITDRPNQAARSLNGVWAALVLAFAVVAVYGRTAGFDFVRYDDQIYVSENPLVLHPSGEQLARLWQAPREGVYIPLAYTCYVAIGRVAFLGQGSGAAAIDAGAFHVASIALHFACAWMVWWVVRQLIHSHWAALVAAMLFAWHPLQVESVAWISGFSGELGALLSLIALSLYLKYVEESSSLAARDSLHRPTVWLFYGAATLAYAGALLCKPQVVTVPLIAGLIAGLWYGTHWRKIVVSLAPWLAMAVAVTLVTAGNQGADSMEFYPAWWMRPFIAGDAITFYMLKLVWPLGLGPDHGHVPRLLVDQTWFYVAWLVPTGMIVGAACLRWGNVAWVSLGIFALALLPVLGLVPFAHQDISTVADRYIYLAMLGPALAVAAWLSTHRRTFDWAGAAVVLVVFAVLSFNQAGKWRDTRTLVDHALRVNDRSWIMRSVKSYDLQHNGKPEQALEQLELAVKKLPGSAIAHHRLAAWQLNHGDYDLARASIQRALEIRPGQSKMLTTLAKVDWAQGHIDRAMETLRQAIDTNPNALESRMALAQLLGQAGRVDEAMTQYEAIIALAPDHAEAISTLSSLLLTKGEVTRAETLGRRAVALAPQWDVAYTNLGTVLFSSQKYEQAIEAFKTALRLNPDAHAVRINLGVALMTAGRLDEAEQPLRRAIQEMPENAAAHYNLGVLLVRLERLSEARAMLLRTLELDSNHQPARVQLETIGQE